MSGFGMISVEHNFETAHRLPFLGGKCENLHGHSWKTKIFFTNLAHPTGMNSQGISVDYGPLKAIVRGWIDAYLDHGCMLGVKDSLLPALLDDDSKVFVFGDMSFLEDMYLDGDKRAGVTYRDQLPSDRNYEEMPWPTVEAVTRMISEEIQHQVDLAMPGLGVALRVEAVEVRETAANTFLWTPVGKEQGPSDQAEPKDLQALRERLQQG